MAIRPDLLLAHRFADISHKYAARDAILYALGVGLGRDPLDADDLGFLLEDRLQVLPTFAVTLSALGMWIRAPEFGVDFSKLVHLEQAASFHAPLPPAAEVVGKARIVSLAARASFPVDLRAALIYRLSGDWNPLHADPEAARRGGFDRPILHGLASYAISGVVISRALGESPTRMSALRCRFSGAVFPGDVIDFNIWREGAGAAFQAFVGERKVMDQGFAALGAAR